MNSKFKVILIWLATFIVLVILFRKMDLQKVIRNLGRVDIKLLLSVSAISLIAHTLINGEKYRRILEFFGCRLPLQEAITVIIGGLSLKSVLPLKSGELVRIAYLRRRHGLSYGRGISSILVKSFLSLLALVIFILGAAVVYEFNRFYAVLSFLLSLLLLALLAGTGYGRRVSSNLRERISPNLPSNPESRRLKGAALLFYSLLFEGIGLVNFYILFGAFNIDIPYRAALLLMPLTMMVASLPITVSGLGTREVSTIVLFARHASPEKLLGVGLSVFFVNFLLPALLGLLFLKPLLNGLSETASGGGVR